MDIELKDTITPAIARLMKELEHPASLLADVGTELVGLTKRNFQSSGQFRPSPWPPKKDGSPSNLKKSGALWQSIRVIDATDESVTIGSDRVYAAIHQFGGMTGRNHAAKMPARPFIPITPDGELIPVASDRIRRVLEEKLAKIFL